MERNSRQRSAMLEALAASKRALTPPELCEMAQVEVPSLNLSTVYRRLKDLVDDGEVLRVELPGQPTRFERAFDDAVRDVHHHHFHCNACDRVYPIHACPGPMKNLAPRGFRVEGHEIMLHGRCASCGPARVGR
ncbi:MAG: transcriptional repressor [Pseudomonadota bacterium]|nr:transcriptional repressor [Pseudomonadota bacterium]